MITGKIEISGKFIDTKPIPDEEYWLLVIDPKHDVLQLRKLCWLIGPNGARINLRWPRKLDIRAHDWDPREDVEDSEYRDSNIRQEEARECMLKKRDGNEY